MEKQEPKPNCLVFELKGSSGFLPQEDASIEVGNRRQWKQIRRHFAQAVQIKLTRFNVLSKERRAEIMKERCNAEHWDWSLCPVTAKQVLQPISLFVCAYTRSFIRLSLFSSVFVQM